MIEAGDLRTGVTLKLDNNLYRVVNTTYNKPGRGKASMRTTLMDLRTGNTVQRQFGAEEKLDNIFVEAEQVDYLYRDGNLLNFMNPATYEQYEASADLFGDDVLYLKEGMQLELRMHEGLAIDYKLPTSVVYKIAEAEVAVAGDTSGKVTKKVTTETGLVVQVPLFVNTGDLIQVDTRDGSYLGRG
ncbi:MAG: elongation factor P [Anaerolineae bacterium]|nr:elongation factor P [Anaerolineae bacterium]